MSKFMDTLLTVFLSMLMLFLLAMVSALCFCLIRGDFKNNPEQITIQLPENMNAKITGIHLEGEWIAGPTATPTPIVTMIEYGAYNAYRPCGTPGCCVLHGPTSFPTPLPEGTIDEHGNITMGGE